MLYKFGIKYAYVIIQNHSLREQYNENSLNALRKKKKKKTRTNSSVAKQPAKDRELDKSLGEVELQIAIWRNGKKYVKTVCLIMWKAREHCRKLENGQKYHSLAENLK